MSKATMKSIADRFCVTRRVEIETKSDKAKKRKAALDAFEAMQAKKSFSELWGEV